MDPSGRQPRRSRFGRVARSGRWARWILLLAIAALAVHVTLPPIRRYPPARSFEGPEWYDPYAVSGGERLRANFHTHSHAWWGLTSGRYTPEIVRAVYRAAGYDVFPLSNYQRIEPPGAGGGIPGIPLTAYEHGFGPFGQHRGVIGADRVSWLEFVLPQGIHHKQQVLDALRDDGSVVVLNHPSRLESYSPEDLRRLVGYDGIELHSRRAGARALWDVALSAGRPVWGFASDDGHRVDDVGDVGFGWVVVHARDRTPGSVLESLRAGAFHAVWSPRQQPPARLVAAGLEGDRLRVELAGPVADIRFIGQGGRLLHRARGRAASYRSSADDPYVRIEAETQEGVLLLNPVFRHGGGPLERAAAPVLAGRTALARGAAAVVVALAGARLLWPGRARRQRVRTSRAAAGPMCPGGGAWRASAAGRAPREALGQTPGPDDEARREGP